MSSPAASCPVAAGRMACTRPWKPRKTCKVRAENITHATITIQNYFRMYEKLSGMTGTAITEAEEFDNIYKLEVVAVPPHVEYLAIGEDSLLHHSVKPKMNMATTYTYYTFSANDEATGSRYSSDARIIPMSFIARQEAKLRAIVTEIIPVPHHRPPHPGGHHLRGSLRERLSKRLRTNMVTRLLQVLLLRKAWFEANNREEDGRTVMAISFLNEPLDSLKTGELNRLAKELEISLNLNNVDNVERLLDLPRAGSRNTRKACCRCSRAASATRCSTHANIQRKAARLRKAAPPAPSLLPPTWPAVVSTSNWAASWAMSIAEERINLEVVKLLQRTWATKTRIT